MSYGRTGEGPNSLPHGANADLVDEGAIAFLMINWAAFSWEAFATLFTGVLAVGGAIYVGHRQVAISDRQSRILEQQAGLDTLKYRSELFDRRFEVYEATARFLGSIMAHANEPEREIQLRFLTAMDATILVCASSCDRSERDLEGELRLLRNEKYYEGKLRADRLIWRGDAQQGVSADH